MYDVKEDRGSGENSCCTGGSVFKKAENVRGVSRHAPKAKKSYPRIACQHIFDEPFGLSDLTGVSPLAPLRTEILSQICADRCSQF